MGGLGSAIEYFAISYAFRELNLAKLNCEVLEGNSTVLRMHAKFMFQDEGFLRAHKQRQDVRLGVHLLGLTKSEWLQNAAAVWERYVNSLERFTVTVHEV